MKTAFAFWENRIAPVFDTALRFHVIETESGRVVSQKQVDVPEKSIVQKALRLVELELSCVVCGAISRPMQDLVNAYGIRIIPFVAGSLQDVTQAWLKDQLSEARFAMPGCRDRERQRARGNYRMNRRTIIMNRQGSGRGAATGKGRGQGGRRSGFRGGSPAAGSSGSCVCPQCGHLEAHERGYPCVERNCPECGTVMTRER